MITHICFVLHLIVAIFACDYKAPAEENITYAIVEYPDGQRPHREKRYERNWDWIRIETEYDPSFNLLSEDKKEVLEDLITSARNYFETTLKVQRVSTIQLRPTCVGESTILPNRTYQCKDNCLKKCNGAVASLDAHYFMHCFCKDGPCPSKQRNWGGKLRNADFVLFVSVNEQGCGKWTLAYASHCAIDETTKRPIAGQVNVCPKQLKVMKDNEVATWEKAIKHELIHVFVFSSSLFTQFPGVKHVMRGPLMNVVPGVIERYTRTDWETAEGMIAHDVYMMVTPRVRSEARKYFNCPDLEGAEIENQGGPGTLGSHWEKRVFENEAMSGVATQVFAISRLTLALFEDSGWYEVNYDKADEMFWGHGFGCDFAKKSCLTWLKANPENPYPYCNIMDDSRCSATRLEKVRCTLAKHVENVPPEYNYNIPNIYRNKKGRPVTGYGHLEVADFCPYYRIYGGSSKEESDTRCTFSDNMNYNNYSLEIFSPTARCFQLDGGIRVKTDRGTMIRTHSVGCYETICKDNRLQIKTQNSKFYPCYHGGQLIHVEKRVHGVGTVRTRIVCPSCAELCGKDFCAPDSNFYGRVGDPTREAIQSRPYFIITIMITFLVVPIFY